MYYKCPFYEKRKEFLRNFNGEKVAEKEVSKPVDKPTDGPADGPTDRPLGYLGGDIMTFGSNLARQYEYDKFKEANIPVDVYSPVQNKSINDKSHMTEEENNHLAEKIVKADVDRLWNSDFVVMCPEQSAIGSMCEVGILYGWKYFCDKIRECVEESVAESEEKSENPAQGYERAFKKLMNLFWKIDTKKNFYHYFDIRTNHLNEKDWRRSFSINQFLYGCILLSSYKGDFQEFDEIIRDLKKIYCSDSCDSCDSCDDDANREKE